MATEYELTIHDYLLIMRRRAPYLTGIFVVGLLLSVVVAIAIPPSYRATGTILVESQLVPDVIVPSAIRNQLDERINTIMQRVMTRESLLQIANKYSIFKDQSGALTTVELTDKMRKRITVETASSSDAIPVRTNQRGQPTMSFMLSFEDQRPEVALQVTNALIAIVLDWNVKMRTEGAAETTAFLTQESESLRREVERLEKLIADYKQQHSNALPEQLTLRMTMLTRAENDLREVERDYRSTKEDLRSLEVELSAAKIGTIQGNPSQTLPALKAELARLSAMYKESHPDIKRLKHMIEAAENTAEPSQSGAASTDVSNPTVYKIQAKIASDNARLSSLAQQREMLQAKIAENESAMISTPKVEQGLDVLIRDRDAAQKKFEELRNKQINAKMAQNLESENKSERFTLLEPPALPEKPFKPNRVTIFMLGLFLSIASSGGAIMALESIDKRIRGTEALTHVLGYRPLVVIPYITIQEEGEHRKRLRKLAIKIAVGAGIAVVAALHFLYMPLDVLLIKILARL
jgi:polysaccharide biosynthesis transport protein